MRGSPTPIEPTPFGKYVLVAKLAEGGMAQIFLGVEQTLFAGRRFVSIKRIHPSVIGDPSFTEYFLTEARVSIKCIHANLPHAYELGVIDGMHYLALEYIRGLTLLEMLRAARKAGRHISVPTMIAVAAGVAAGLQHLHELTDIDGAALRVIHRDVTPANVMISYDGGVKLIDLGIAHTTLQTHKTATGILKGKFGYQAPEQIERPSAVDHRADLFTLGIVMHETLTGRPLFTGQDNRETLLRVLRGPIADPANYRPDVPPELSAILYRALERDPASRYSSAGELLWDLERAAERAGVSRSPLKLRAELVDLAGFAPPMSVHADGLITLVQALPEDGLAGAGQGRMTVPPSHTSDGYDIEVEWDADDPAAASLQLAVGSGGGASAASAPLIMPSPPTAPPAPARSGDDPEYNALLSWLK